MIVFVLSPDQRDQMAIFFKIFGRVKQQYFAHKDLKVSRICSKNLQTLYKPSKLLTFRQIWSHCSSPLCKYCKKA